MEESAVRARQFIFEYNREKTAGVFGKKLVAAFQKDQGYFPPGVARYHDFIQGKTLDQIPPEQLKIIPNIVLEMLEGADPTANKEYVQWLAKVYANENVKLEDLTSKTTEWLQKYDLYKKKRFFTGSDAKLANIMNLSWRDLWDISIRADFQMKVQQADEKAMPKGDADQVYENDKVRIIIPKDKEAACYYGQGTQWCTAATQSQNYFNNYSSQGPLYILLPKSPKYPGEKYQLHFPSGQFMDEQDNSVDSIIDLLEMRFGNLVPFFREREPEINNWLVFTPDEILEPLIEKIKTAVNDHLSELVSEYEMDDDYWYQSLRDEGYVYPEGHEEEGQIDWDKVADADISYLDFATDLQDLISDVNNAVDLTPEEVRNLAAEVASEWGADTQEVRDLDKIVAYSVENARSRSRDGDGGVPEWINKHVYVKKLDTSWTVTIIYHDKDGKAREYEIRS